MSARVTEAVTRLREKYDAPLAMTAKNGGLYDLATMVGAELSVLQHEATEADVLLYLKGMTKGYELAATRSAPELKVFTAVVNPEDERRVTAPEGFPRDVVVETYLAVEPFESLHDAISAHGRLNNGRYYADIAPFDKPIMVRVIGL